VELTCSWRFEQEALRAGHARVAGADEVGRGALCGPVVAAAVVLGDGFETEGIDDSKRLTERQRETQAARIRAGAVALGLAWCEPEEIDRLNILRATHLAIRRAVLALEARTCRVPNARSSRATRSRSRLPRPRSLRRSRGTL
jgi:ribonuclease HII